MARYVCLGGGVFAVRFAVFQGALERFDFAPHLALAAGDVEGVCEESRPRYYIDGEQEWQVGFRRARRFGLRLLSERDRRR